MAPPEKPSEQCLLPQNASPELNAFREKWYRQKQETAKVLLEIFYNQKTRLPEDTAQTIEKQHSVLSELTTENDFKNFESKYSSLLCGPEGVYTIVANFQQILGQYPTVEEFLKDTSPIPLEIAKEEQKEDPLDEAGSGGATVYIPPKPKPPEEEESEKPIDPGELVPSGKTLEERFPEIARIIRRLEEISNEEFFAKNRSLIKYVEGVNWDKIEISWDKLKFWKKNKPWWKIKNPELWLVVDMAEITDEAMLYQAIVNGWSEKELYEQHRKAMHELYRECFDRGVFRSMADWGKSAWLGIVTGEPETRKPNWSIENRKIKITEKRKLFNKLTREIAKKFIDGDNYCIRWNHGNNECGEDKDDEDFNPDIIKFIHERAIPFYASVLIDEAIVEDFWEEKLEQKFKDVLASLYSSAQI